MGRVKVWGYMYPLLVVESAVGVTSLCVWHTSISSCSQRRDLLDRTRAFLCRRLPSGRHPLMCFDPCVLFCFSRTRGEKSLRWTEFMALRFAKKSSLAHENGVYIVTLQYRSVNSSFFSENFELAAAEVGRYIIKLLRTRTCSIRVPLCGESLWSLPANSLMSVQWLTWPQVRALNRRGRKERVVDKTGGGGGGGGFLWSLLRR